MGLSLKPRSLKRYKDIAALFLKYGRSDLLRSTGLDEALDTEARKASPRAVAQAHELAEDLEKMGATYIKLGQLLSTRGDILPPACAEALSRLQDKVAPVPFSLIEEIVETELQVRTSKLFAELDPAPLACASLGQVHRATMRDGRPVVVKVQRPGLRERILEDMEALEGVDEQADARSLPLGERPAGEPAYRVRRRRRPSCTPVGGATTTQRQGLTSDIEARPLKRPAGPGGTIRDVGHGQPGRE